MSKTIVTISREFGSGGRYIGKQLAEKLGIPFYDKEIIAKVAEKTGYAKEFIEKSGEYASSSSIFSYAFVGRTSTGLSTDDYIFMAQRKIIQEIADQGSCVIVGRCADYILKDRDDVLNVFIYGDKPEKIKRLNLLYKMNEKEALAAIKEMDKKRSVNYQYCTDQKWGDRKNYDICLNSSSFGYDRCADIIEELMK